VGRREALEQYYPTSKQATLTTLRDWLARFGFPQRSADESLEGYRARARVAVYFNANELGLGREMGCTLYMDADQEGRPAKGLACYVSNYGLAFQLGLAALREAELGLHQRSTVVISYQPSLPSGYEVQFATYGAEVDGRGHLADSAQLDAMGQRPVPQICTNCHGGIYDPAMHLVRGAHFLPVNLFSVAFDDVAPYRMSDQADALRYINDLAFETDLQSPTRDVLLAPAQKDYLRALYGIDEHASAIPESAIAEEERAPLSWASSGEARDLWRYTILPYCATCHNALPPSGVNAVESYASFAAAWPTIKHSVCESYSMPHAQPTLERFWSASVVVGQNSFRSPKALLAATMDGGADDCEYRRGAGCTVGNDQAASNARCGDPSTSGRYCRLSAAGGEGLCEDGCGAAAGGVGCIDVGSNRQQCGASNRCEPCGRLGQRSCGGACAEGTPTFDGAQCVERNHRH
jgi:hypothetical protein